MYSLLSRIGARIELTNIIRITGVKNSGVIKPRARPFCAVISATSPLVIIPTPILRLS